MAAEGELRFCLIIQVETYSINKMILVRAHVSLQQ